MSKQVNPTAVGIFVLGAFILGIAAFVLLGSGDFFSNHSRFILYFDDSINGLESGADVKFRGVSIGQVESIYLRYKQPDSSSHVPVIIKIDNDRLRKALNVNLNLEDQSVLSKHINELGLRGRLQVSSLVTGLLFVDLNYYDGAEAYKPIFVQDLDADPNLPALNEVPTIPMEFSEIFKKMTGMLNEVSSIEIKKIADNVSQIIESLKDQVSKVELDKISSETIDTLNDIQALVNNEKIVSLISNSNDFVIKVTGAVDNIDTGVTEIRGFVSKTESSFTSVADNLNARLDQLEETLKNINQITDPNSSLSQKMDYTLTELSLAARSMRQLADYLERNPSSLLTGKQNTSK